MSIIKSGCNYISSVQRSVVELSAPESGIGPSLPGALIDEIFPNMCKRITQPMYATENNNMVFGDIVHPSASSPKKDRLCCGYFGPLAASGLLPPVYFVFSAAIFFAKSFLSPPSILKLFCDLYTFNLL